MRRERTGHKQAQQRIREVGARASKNTMGLSLRMADFSSAFAFAGVLQATSCTPVDGGRAA